MMNPENIEKICQSVFDAIIEQKDGAPFFNYDGIKVGYCVYRQQEITVCFTVGNDQDLVSFEMKFPVIMKDEYIYNLFEKEVKNLVKMYLERGIEKLKTKTENPETKEN
jgi:hypothetical protein